MIDGAINKEPYGDYQTIHPDEIAKTYLQFHRQDKSAWAWEVELRTFGGKILKDEKIYSYRKSDRTFFVTQIA